MLSWKIFFFVFFFKERILKSYFLREGSYFFNDGHLHNLCFTDMTPCMSPLPHDSLLLEKPGLGQIEEENEGSGFKPMSGKQ